MPYGFLQGKKKKKKNFAKNTAVFITAVSTVTKGSIFDNVLNKLDYVEVVILLESITLYFGLNFRGGAILLRLLPQGRVKKGRFYQNKMLW